MARLLSVLLSLVILALATQIGTPRHAYACSTGPDFNPVAKSDVIVEGRFLGYEVLPDTEMTRGSPYVPVKVEMAVQRVFKGEVVGTTISLVDPVSLSAHDEDAWIGASGACGAFDADPTGRYAIMGLSRNEDGTYRPHRMFWFFLGDGPDGDVYVRALERIASFADAAELPPLGSGSGPSGGGREVGSFVAAGAAILGVALLGTSAAVRVRGRRRW